MRHTQLITRLGALLLTLAAGASIRAADLPPSVGPLLTTTWGQRAPYNYMCPLKSPAPWGGYQPDQQHCRVGCVAVAMGQIMRFHSWPQSGQGSNSVVYPLLSLDAHTFSVDFSQATYDWGNMADDYSADYTDTQARAVAQLLYHCAVASNMLFERTFSFSTNFTAGDALAKYFHYDASQMRTLLRSQYSRDEWMQLVKSELAAGRPIFYEAISISLTEGIYAHSFVIDGYNADGLVHVNWGWYGHEDGYYDIDLLDPPGYRFNAYQDMIVGIQPVAGDAPFADAIVDLNADAAAGDATPANVYSLDGRLVRAGATSLSGLPAGVYIWHGRKVVRRAD